MNYKDTVNQARQDVRGIATTFRDSVPVRLINSFKTRTRSVESVFRSSRKESHSSMKRSNPCLQSEAV